jgi:Cell division control protein 14, SIN component
MATLIIALTDNPVNARVFESVDGLLAVSSLLRDPDTSRTVKKAIYEFLYFYLLSEEPKFPSPGTARYQTGTVLRVGGQRPRTTSTDSNSTTGSIEWSDVSELDGHSLTKAPAEKQKLLAKYLDSADELANVFMMEQIFAGITT